LRQGLIQIILYSKMLVLQVVAIAHLGLTVLAQNTDWIFDFSNKGYDFD